MKWFDGKKRENICRLDKLLHVTFSQGFPVEPLLELELLLKEAHSPQLTLFLECEPGKPTVMMRALEKLNPL
ncbi:unnamed protein product [Allacma fusca]|uniref:Uncharacterized protein n=1 Tax=Allacma fusca TaxID=39272 RepID=A0A8J2P1Z9_9HEXA|nr:unnamed protein product [Allacma fusca]